MDRLVPTTVSSQRTPRQATEQPVTAPPSARALVVGEVLWDALPRGLFIGGAPFNVAAHLHTLGVDACFVSRVGDDRLGREVCRRVTQLGLAADLVQVDTGHETGFVEVDLDHDGIPSYTIVEPVAWDHIAWTDGLAAEADGASMVIFGSLAQRSPTTRATLERMLSATPTATAVFDINLRAPFVDRAVVERSLARADIVKLNDDELVLLQAWYGLPDGMDASAEGLMERFAVDTLCVTRGAEGALLWHEGERYAHPGYQANVVDTVGAGDSFLAMLLTQLLAGAPGAEALDWANRLGAYVAGQPGATPVYSRRDLFDLPAK
ncbi:MAG: carbohydrate kinase [Bacteroidota bacterium]